ILALSLMCAPAPIEPSDPDLSAPELLRLSPPLTKPSLRPTPMRTSRALIRSPLAPLLPLPDLYGSDRWLCPIGLLAPPPQSHSAIAGPLSSVSVAAVRTILRNVDLLSRFARADLATPPHCISSPARSSKRSRSFNCR